MTCLRHGSGCWIPLIDSAFPYLTTEKRLQARKALKSQSSNSTSTDAPSTSEPTTSIMSPPPVSSVTPAITTALDTPTKPTRTAAGVNILIESEEMSRRGSTISDSGSAGGSGNTSIVGSPAKNGTPGKVKGLFYWTRLGWDLG